jgi:hypothetical protein
MKVVVAHNRYVSAVPSGENMVVDADIAMLREAGVEVIPFIKDSDTLTTVGAKLKAATGPVWAPSVRELADLLDREKPDVLHLHNVYPLISPHREIAWYPSPAVRAQLQAHVHRGSALP